MEIYTYELIWGIVLIILGFLWILFRKAYSRVYYFLNKNSVFYRTSPQEFLEKGGRMNAVVSGTIVILMGIILIILSFLNIRWI